MRMRIAIVGAGPVGIEAALQAGRRGHAVRVFEKGRAGSSVRAWQHVRMFSPFSMNSSTEGRALVAEAGLPAGDALLTGREFVEGYLDPLADALGGVVETGVEVVAISRAGTRKGELIGEDARGEQPFELLLRRGDEEWTEVADVVLDCSGTYGNWNRLGAGGAFAPGERVHRNSILYGAPDVAGAERERVAGRRVLVVGAGHSAATVIQDLAGARKSAGGTQVTWISRRNGCPPCRSIENDPLAGRADLAARVNALAESSNWLDFRGGCSVAGIRDGAGSLRVALHGPGGGEEVEADVIVAATGFRPDLELARELQVTLCYATEGSYHLAAELLGETGGDCLASGSFGIETLRHPERGYFALGTKSYGRTPDFLLRIGYEQVQTVLDWMDGQ